MNLKLLLKMNIVGLLLLTTLSHTCLAIYPEQIAGMFKSDIRDASKDCKDMLQTTDIPKQCATRCTQEGLVPKSYLFSDCLHSCRLEKHEIYKSCLRGYMSALEWKTPFLERTVK